MSQTENILQYIINPLLAWYDDHARVLPWRKNTDPYRVWISEIMLQQTRVETVIPYYERFLTVFPDVKALADADEEHLLKCWEGLGYYSRARNLQKAANMICEEYGGVFPNHYNDILKLPGVGAYTAGAIASIAFGLPEPAVDGNVLRVLARLREDADDIADAGKKKAVAEELRQIYPEAQRRERCGDLTQSLMELGAVVCLPNSEPLCRQCPLKDFCMAKQHNTQMELPVKTRKKPRKKQQKTVLLLCCQDKIAIEKRPAKGLLADLWQFPVLDDVLMEEEISAWLRMQDVRVNSICPAGQKKHIFTHIEWEMHGYLVGIDRELEVLPERTDNAKPLLWVTEEALRNSYSLPSAFQAFAAVWYGENQQCHAID